MKFPQKNILVLFLLTNFLLPCTSCKKKETKNHSSETFIEIGNTKLTRHELDKDLSRFSIDYEKKFRKKPPADSIKKEVQDFVDYAYLLAGAYEKRYNENRQINAKVLATSKYMMGKDNSPFWQKLIFTKRNIADKSIGQHVAAEKVYDQYVQPILSSSALIIDEAIVKKMTEKIIFGPYIFIDTLSVKDLLGINLFSYHVKNNTITYTVGSFIDYFNNMLPFRQQLKTETQYTNYIRSMALNDIVYDSAIALGLTEDPEFALDQYSFKNRVIAEAFKKNELFKNITVTKSDIKNEYEKQKPAFVMPAFIEASVFIFGDIGKALRSMRGLKQLKAVGNNKYLIDTNLIKGLTSYTFHTKIAYTSAEYDHRVIQQLFIIPDNSFTRPVMAGNKTFVVKREKSIGTHNKTFEEVKEQIKNNLVKKEEERILTTYLLNAKKKYTLKKYFKEEDIITVYSSQNHSPNN